MPLFSRRLLVFIFIGVSLSIIQGCGKEQNEPIGSAPQETMTPTPVVLMTPTPEPVIPEKTPEVEPTLAQPTLAAENVNALVVKPAIDSITLDEIKGIIALRQNKPLLVYFWSTWCGPCIEEIPFLVELYSKYGNQVDFLAVSCDSFTDSVEKVPTAMQALKMTFSVRVLKTDDQNQAIAAIDSNWQGALPAIFIYNTQSEKIKSFLGAQTKEAFDAAIQESLKTVGKVRFPLDK